MELASFIDQLGLNRYEKETLIFLASVDHANAHTLYKNTKVPKGRIYSVLNSLIEKGFIQCIPTSPKRYTIKNVKSSLKDYLETKQSQIRKQIEEVNALEIKPKAFSLEKKSPSVYTFTGREEHLNALISLRNQAKKSLIQVAPLFVGTFASNLSLYKAIGRGIKTRIILRKVTSENKKLVQECIQLGAKIRQTDSKDIIYFLVKDHDEFILGAEDYRNQEERLSLYSKNKGLLLVLENYFENLWKKSKPIK